MLAHKVAITLEACHAREVIEQAFVRWGTPDIVNTDQGSQFIPPARRRSAYEQVRSREAARGQRLELAANRLSVFMPE